MGSLLNLSFRPRRAPTSEAHLVHSMSAEVGLCAAYLKGKCHRGKACRYRHDKDQKKAQVAHLRDKRFNSDSDDEDGPSVLPAVTKVATNKVATNSSNLVDAEERKKLAAERARQLDFITASVPAEPESKTVSFHHGVLPKKGRTENPERQARKEKAREVRQEAAKQAKADEEKSAAAALSMAPEWDVLKKAATAKEKEQSRLLKEEMIRRQVEVSVELGDGGNKEAADLWAQVEAARRPKKKQKKRK